MKQSKSKRGMKWRIRVFNSLSLPALILSPDKIIVDINRNFQEKFGIKKKQIIGRTCHDFFYHSQEPCTLDDCPFAMVLAERIGHSTLRRVVTPDGHAKWEDRVFSPIFDDQGDVAYIIETIRDVTQVKTLERRLSGIREFTHKLIESSTSAIIAADREGRVLIMNRAAEELTGYSIDEARGKITVEDLHPPGQAKEIMKLLRDERTGGKGKLPSRRVSLVNVHGDKIPVELTAAIIYEDGREVGTMGVFNDLREKLEEEERGKKIFLRIAQAEKMASLGQLAAGVAHEINNPLTGILLYVGMVQESLDEQDPRQKDLGLVIEDINRCREIVKNLLAYSRKSNVGKEILHLNILLEHGLSLIRDQKLFMNVEIVKELSSEMLMIKGDRNQLSQIIINLVMNAVDAMDHRGVITLRTYLDRDKQKACLEVSDTGCGIPIENLSRIFDPFFTTKGPGEGTGLGLSTVYGIVRDCGGDVWVKETGKSGTTFVVELPLYQGTGEDAAPSFY